MTEETKKHIIDVVKEADRLGDEISKIHDEIVKEFEEANRAGGERIHMRTYKMLESCTSAYSSMRGASMYLIKMGGFDPDETEA